MTVSHPAPPLTARLARFCLARLCLAGLAVATLGLAGCNEAVRVTATERSPNTAPQADTGNDPAVIKVIQSLQCPQTLGSLTRKGPLAENGRKCTYTGPRGSEINLHLVVADESNVADVLKVFETQLESRMPEALAALAERRREASATAQAEATPTGAATPSASEGSGPQTAQVNLPGIRINADGDNASIRIGGLHIDAAGNNADVNITGRNESVSIQAADRVAEVRARQGGDSLRLNWSLTSDDPSAVSGLRRVGYEARGPLSGPVVVATYQSRTDGDSDSLDDDVRELVVLNVGG